MGVILSVSLPGCCRALDTQRPDAGRVPEKVQKNPKNFDFLIIYQQAKKPPQHW
ncbi:hypothetical protein [Pararhodobacter sp.]|uniref:hypothetical protein n=1 Tax=Pararhodobacter sp. TaxID=2127056 RepID=UPI002FDD0108